MREGGSGLGRKESRWEGGREGEWLGGRKRECVYVWKKRGREGGGGGGRMVEGNGERMK